ncbi:S1 RNA-binding domain-containing protein [Alkalicella caledoniensis]|uniref:S1 RNA-binding domain-containing protein n=1 Tax=Alkalicella caledoniensis TaxID=2731377 RepID=A0A7G9W9U6_ALKCA|nr:S1-like domain-containing RNA-binding protein [Alkalicella caledoniensis]QNO15458.1 S1 RNA-binding domain-containing protein [Alkalicella caledoniensis]
MIRLGEKQTLVAIRKSSVGMYLSSREDDFAEEVLLPNSQVPAELEEGNEIEVFIYRDSEDRIIATPKKPRITLDEVTALKVKEVTKIGAWLDWGLPKDLLLPYKEQKGDVEAGKYYMVGLYIDNSDRLCATMRLYDFLRTDSPYQKDDKIKGVIYDVNNDLGALVAVDYKFNGLIPRKELFEDYKVGDIVEARVTKVREDGKLDLSLREKSYIQMDIDAEFIQEKLDENGGILLLNDKSSPELIKEQLNMSKGAFKKAVGKLLKENKIKFIENGIEKI